MLLKVVLVSSTCASDCCLTINARFSFISDKMLVYGLMIARFFQFEKEIMVNLVNLSDAETKTHKTILKFCMLYIKFYETMLLIINLLHNTFIASCYHKAK